MKLPPHVKVVLARGRPYYYLERHRGTGRAEKRQRLPNDPTSAEFWAEYARLLGVAVKPPNPNSFDIMIAEYLDSSDYRGLAKSTRAQYGLYARKFLAMWGPLEVRGLTPRNIVKARDAMESTPAAANAMLRSLSAILSWSVPMGFRDDNPVEHVRKLKGGVGYAPWPWEVIDTVERESPPWFWQAAALALYTGQRQGDVLAMRWSHIERGGIWVRQEKTNALLWIPIHARLQVILDTIPKRAVQILTNTKRGTPWTTDGFKSSWGKAQPTILKDNGFVFHGLRKSAVVTLLEAGATSAQVAAVTGQSLTMVEHYAKQVNQARLAASAILTWERSQR